MKKNNTLCCTILSLMLAGISIETSAKNNAEAVSCNNEVQQYRMSVKFQHRSAEVQALQIQAYNIATARLKEIIKQHPDAQNLAIVTDLDETVIDNTDVFVNDLKKCQVYTDWKSWDEWERVGQP